MSKDTKISKKNQTQTWVVYILECNDGTLYTGITNNLEKRIAAHTNGTGAKYTKGRGPFTLMRYEPFENKSTASKRERIIKQMTKKEKLSLIEE